jgi:class 3 adenylate cyclase/tetratricopeptide (TPR) repeat protein
MLDLAQWLEKLGMSEYTQRFAENGINVAALPHLTDQDLKDIGVLLGHRRVLLAAIRELAGDFSVGTKTATTEEAKAQDTAERRQVTVMFSDLVGSTALSARMDPEDLRDIISTYQKAVAETVQRFGGFVAKYMGDGVLVYFGYPQAHEDDAERAVRAGLELIEVVGGLKFGAPLQTRVGIATGLVVVGDLIGSGSAQEQAAVGETPNLAARLQGIAEPNTVVIAEDTRRLLGNLFELEDLGPKDLKGIAEPVRAWAALRASSVESRFEALRTATTPLVGREEEIELLMRRWTQAKAGDGCVVLISGEPGIGKSRLAEAMEKRLGTEPHTRVRFFCSPYHQDSALYPAVAQMERAAGFRRQDTADQRLTKLEALLAQATNDVGGVAPLFADLLSIPTGERYPALTLTPQKRKEKTLQALVAQAEGLAVRQPVLMIFEDVHWSDPSTRELLDLLIERVTTVRLLVIITFRPEFSPPWVGRPQVTLLTLNRLPPRQRAVMISRMIGGKALPREIADQIVERTDGVPLFIEELTKAVIESGVVADVGGRYTTTGTVPSLAIPTSLHASLLARLDRLAPTREIAQIGATLGRSFSHELISAVASISQPLLDDALDQLVRAELMFRRGTPPEAEYTFKHALVQDAAYSTLLRSRRQQLHGRIAATLESRFPEMTAAQPQLMAQHCAEASMIEKAINYWLKAGQQALARSAMTEAVSQLQKGLALLESLPEGTSRQQQELDLQVALVSALSATKGYAAPEVGDTLARARVLAEQLDRPEYLLGLLFGLSAYHAFRSELRLAHSIAQQIEQIGKTRKDRAWLSLGHHIHGRICGVLGEFTAARELFGQCEGLDSIANRALYAAFSPEDIYTINLVGLSATLARLGYLDQAQSCATKALREARKLGQPYTLVAVLGYASWALWPSGLRLDVDRRAEEIIAVSNELGFPLWAGWGMVHRGWSATALGRAEEGCNSLKEGLLTLQATGQLISLPWVHILLAEAYAKLGQLAEDLNSLAEAARLIETTEERIDEAELHRLRGDLMSATGDQVAAEENYQRALAVARRQSARTYELRAATSLAQLWRDGSKRAEARNLLVSVYGWFTEGFGTPVLQKAKALLDDLGGDEHGAALARPGQAG